MGNNFYDIILPMSTHTLDKTQTCGKLVNDRFFYKQKLLYLLKILIYKVTFYRWSDFGVVLKVKPSLMNRCTFYTRAS